MGTPGTRLMAGVVVLALAVAWGFALDRGNDAAFGYLTAALILLLFTALLALFGPSLNGLVKGRDNRVSTSKLQVVIWTYAIAFSLLSLIALTWVGANAGFDAITEADFDFADYLFLLGGPFAAAVAARYLIGTKVDRGDLAKPPADAPTVADAFSDDSGDADLIDSQYLLFNVIALVYFFGAFFSAPSEGLPDIPAILFSLTSASAAAYVANKGIAKGAPVITGLCPQRGGHGDLILVHATNLFFPKAPSTSEATTDAAAAHPNNYRDVCVTVGGVHADILAGSVSHSSTGEDTFKIQIPADAPVGPADVKALNFRGAETNAKPLQVTDPANSPAASGSPAPAGPPGQDPMLGAAPGDAPPPPPVDPG